MTALAVFFLAVIPHAISGWPLSLETEADLRVLQPSGLKTLERVQKHASDGEWALRVVFPGSEKDTWPGFFVLPPNPDFSENLALIFDVFNPSDKQFNLSWRIDDLDGGKVFGGTTIRPKETKRVEIWTRPLRLQLNVKRIQRFYLYSRMPREDWELFFDNFRIAESSQVFRKVTHVPTRRPETAAGNEGPAFIAFQRPWMDHVFSDDWPEPGERVEALSLAAALGEYEPVTVCIAAGRNLRGLRAEITDFGGPASISRDHVEIRVVQALDKRWTYHDPHMRYLAQVPVLLEPQPRHADGTVKGIDLSAGQVATFFITVKVPPDAKPGSYEAKLTVAAEEPASDNVGPAATSLPVRLRVYPFTLPEVTDKFWGVYYTGPRPLEPGQELDQLKQDLVDMREHGMTSVGLCFGWDVAQTDVENRRVDFMFPGRGRYETFMDLYAKLKFPAPVLQLSDTVQGAVAARIPIGDPRFADAYADTWKFVAEYAKQKKWPEIIVQPVDEPAWQGEAEKERNRQLLEILKRCGSAPSPVQGKPDDGRLQERAGQARHKSAAPQRLTSVIRTEQDGPGDDYFHNVAGPLADVWNYNGSLADPPVIEAAKAQGKVILIYNCDVEWYRPVVDRYVAGWFQVLSGADGCFNWAYQSFAGDPYDDQDAQYGDHLARYPATGDRPGGPSIAWEAFREGVDDFKYVALLKSLMARAREKRNQEARRLADLAQRELDALVQSLSYSPRVRDSANFERYWEEGGQLFVSGLMSLPNGWKSEDYDRARRTIADLAARLLSVL